MHLKGAFFLRLNKGSETVQKFLPEKGNGALFIFIVTVVFDALILGILNFSDSYEIAVVLQVSFIALNLYQLYYLLICLTMYYEVGFEELRIISFWGMKKVVIPFADIKCYNNLSGKIKGMRLSGYGRDYFAIGRSVVEKIGPTYMYVTNSKNIIYIKTDDMNYGLSPKNVDKFLQYLSSKEVCELSFNYKSTKHVTIFKDKKFTIPFILCTILSGIIILYPVIRYLNHTIPDIMPLSFDAKFKPIAFGTGKQFAFKQMTLGILNLAILFCMYFASVFIAKYDRKAVYKFIAVPLILALVFLILQTRIFLTFK